MKFRYGECSVHMSNGRCIRPNIVVIQQTKECPVFERERKWFGVIAYNRMIHVVFQSVFMNNIVFTSKIHTYRYTHILYYKTCRKK